jgi:protein-disulfide isomerase
MENRKMDADRWVEERLGALEPGKGFRPDAARALASLHRRNRMRRIRWVGLAAAAAVIVAAMVVPAPCSAASTRPCGGSIARRLWDTVFEQPGVATAPPAARVEPAAYKQEGSFSAPIVCEIYSDYACPACAGVNRDIIPLLNAEYVATGKVRLVHRDFPLPQHIYSRLAARFANAVGRLGKFEIAANQLFLTQTVWGINGDLEGQLAHVLSPEIMQQARDMVSRDATLEEGIAADVAMGKSDEIRQTPTLMVVAKGKRQAVAPIPEYALLKAYLDRLLK